MAEASFESTFAPSLETAIKTASKSTEDPPASWKSASIRLPFVVVVPPIFGATDFEVGSELQGGFLERYDDIGVGPVSNQAADNAALERLLCFRWMLSAGDFGRSRFAGTSPSVKNYVQQEDTLHPDLSLYGAQS